MPRPRPRMNGVLETVLYFSDEEKTQRFYSEVLGFRLVGREPGRSFFYRAGKSVFLLFRADETLKGNSLPPHGAQGPVHTCFVVPADEYENWKAYLTEHDVPVIHQLEWPLGLSFYFHDPDGNLLEIANNDLWPA
jgi:catechol 2,3-dioxygenase-like lactoylglutathione lyase family enzyme